MRIIHAYFFRNLAMKNWGGTAPPVDYGYKILLSLVQGKKRVRIIEEAEKLETVQREESMMWTKFVFETGAKNKTRLTEKNSRPNRWAFRGKKVRHPELEKRLCDYVDDKRQYGCTVTSEMCQMKAVAVSKELGITGFKATLHLCQEAPGERVLTASNRIGAVWQRSTMLSTHTSRYPLLAWDSL